MNSQHLFVHRENLYRQICQRVKPTLVTASPKKINSVLEFLCYFRVPSTSLLCFQLGELEKETENKLEFYERHKTYGAALFLLLHMTQII